MIYFIRDTQTNAVKIGRSTNPSKRLTELQTGSAHYLELMAVLPGDADVEDQLHRRFATHRIRGEWFWICDAMLDFFRSQSTQDDLRAAYHAYMSLGAAA